MNAAATQLQYAAEAVQEQLLGDEVVSRRWK